MQPVSSHVSLSLPLSNPHRVQSPGAGHAGLEAQLLELMDGPVGDAVAALPTSQRGSPAFADLARTVCGGLCTAVLRHRMGDVRAVRLIRRFAAALLPDDGGDGGSDGSTDGDTDSDMEVDGGGSGGREAVESEAVASAAVDLLQRLMAHSRFLPLMRSAAASPPALAPAVQALPRPLASLLPLAEADGGGDPSAESAAGSSGGGGGGGEPEAGACLKAELCELLETLLDLQDRFAAPGSGTRQAVAGFEDALLLLVMAAYGGSLSRADRAAWSLAQVLNLRRWRAAAGAAAGEAGGGEEREEREEREEVAALLQGPLSASCFAWGEAAAALQQARGSEARRAEVIEARLLAIDPARCALTVAQFPEWRCLTGNDGAPAAPPPPSAGGAHAAAAAAAAAAPTAAQALPHAVAGYDPAFLLPACVAGLAQGRLAPHGFAALGLLSVCLRCLAAEDAPLRALAYQALALFAQRLEGAEFREKLQLRWVRGPCDTCVS